MKRLNVYITEPQDAFLKEAGGHLSIKPSELLRRILDDYRATYTQGNLMPSNLSPAPPASNITAASHRTLYSFSAEFKDGQCVLNGSFSGIPLGSLSAFLTGVYFNFKGAIPAGIEKASLCVVDDISVPLAGRVLSNLSSPKQINREELAIELPREALFLSLDGEIEDHGSYEGMMTLIVVEYLENGGPLCAELPIDPLLRETITSPFTITIKPSYTAASLQLPDEFMRFRDHRSLRIHGIHFDLDITNEQEELRELVLSSMSGGSLCINSLPQNTTFPVLSNCGVRINDERVLAAPYLNEPITLPPYDPKYNSMAVFCVPSLAGAFEGEIKGIVSLDVDWVA